MKLKDRIDNIKKVRFEASRRMKRNRIASTTAVAMLSVYNIGINLLGIHTKFKDYAEEIALISIMLSVFVLVFSLLINLLQYEYRERNYHECGLEFSRLKDNIEASSEEDKKYLEEYHKLLRFYNLNHDEIDYMHVRARDNDNVGWWKKTTGWLRWNVWDVYMIYWAFALIPAIVLVVFFWMKYS